MDEREQTQKKIMDAAKARFRQYGFNKTTMVEIAKDCGMSAANIYRFFEGKNDIATEMAKDFFRDTEDALREVILRPNLTPVERLRLFTWQALQCNHSMYNEEPKIGEVVDFISEKRYDLIDRHVDTIISLIAEILAEGNRNGIFGVKDIVSTGEIFLKATLLFHCPYLMERHTFAELENYCELVVNLLVRGLEVR